MKRILLCALCVLCGRIATFADDTGSAVAAPSATSPDAPLVNTLFSDGSTNSWTQADLIAALQLMNRKYHRDIETPGGRTAWHGKLVMQTIDTNRLVKIERYADGTEFEFPFEPPKPKTPAPTKSANLPARLAEARARRQAEKATTNIVTVVVTPDCTWDFNNPETMEKLDNLSREEVDALPPDVRRAYFYFDAERKATKEYVAPDK